MDKCQKAFDKLKVLCTSTPPLAFTEFNKTFKLHTNASAIGLGAVLYQEQHGKDSMIGYTSRALSRSEFQYPAHKLAFLVLKWAATESFRSTYMVTPLLLTSIIIPFTYALTTTKLDAMGSRWIAKIAKFIFTVYYQLRKSKVEADALMENYACHEEAISSLILESPPVWMTVTAWVWPLKADPTINQVITWIENKRMETVKVGEEMLYELKQYLRKGGGCVSENEFCIDRVFKLDGTVMNCNWYFCKNIDLRLCLGPTLM